MNIQSELEKATGLTKGKAELQDYLESVTRAVASLPDATWDGLSSAAQTWFNESATSLNNEMDLPSFLNEVAEKPKPARAAVAKKVAPVAVVEEAPVEVAEEEAPVSDTVEEDEDEDDEYEAELAALKARRDAKLLKKAEAKAAADKVARESLEDDAEVGNYNFPKQRSAGNFVKLVLAESPMLSIAEVVEIVEASEYEAKGNAVQYAFDEMTRLHKLLAAAGFQIVHE